MAAKRVLIDPVVTIATVDYSSEISQASLPIQSETLPTTVFTSAGWREVAGGEKSADLTLEVIPNADPATGIGAYLRTAAFNTVVAFTVAAEAGAAGASNPIANGSILLRQQLDIGGRVNQLGTQTLNFPVSGAITWDVTP